VKYLINRECIKDMHELYKTFSDKIRMENGDVLDDVLWVADTLMCHDNYHAFCHKGARTVGSYAFFNKKAGVNERLDAVLPVLNALWHDFAIEYNNVIIPRGVCCTTSGVWEVFKNLRKKLREGKEASFTAGGVRLTVDSKDKILIKYGDSMEKTLVFIRKGDSFAVDVCASDFTTCKKQHVWLDVTAGRAEYSRLGLFQDILDLLQAPVWETADVPTHIYFTMFPPALIKSVRQLPLETTPDALGASKLFDLFKTARRLEYGNA